MNKLLNNKLFVIFLVLPFVEPRGVKEMAVYIGGPWAIFDEVFDILKVAAFVFILVVSLLSLRRLSPMLLLCALYEAIIVFSSIINHNFTLSGLINVVTVIGVCILIEFFIKTNRSAILVDVLSKILEVFICINFITLILYPDGMYINNRGWNDNYFLGYRNLHIYVYLIYSAIKATDNYIKKRTRRFDFGITDIIILLSAVKCNSSTTLVAMSIFYLSVCLFEKRKIPEIVNITTSYFLSFTISFLIFFVDIQRYFSFFIEDILGKNLTFTSRTKIWDKVLQSIKESPIVGKGSISYNNIFSWTVTQAHNQFLDVLLMGGILLFAVFAAMMILTNNRLGLIKSKEEYRPIHNKILFIYIGYFILFLMEARRDDVYMFMIFIFVYHLAEILRTTKAASTPKRRILIRFGRRLSE